MSAHPKAKGILGEARVLSKLLSAGFSVSVPFGDNSPYDLIVDTGTSLYKVQVRTGRLINGAISASTISTRWNSTGSRKVKPTDGSIDYYAIVYEEDVYIVPFLDASKTTITLRVEPPKNNQDKHILWANTCILSSQSFEHPVTQSVL